MERNHYGKMVDSKVPIVGVVTNHEPEFLIEDITSHGIDIDLEEYLSECESEEDEQAVHDTWDTGTLIVGFEEWDFKAHFENPDMTIEEAVELCEEHQPFAVFAGEKIFVPDRTWEYQAIVGEVYTQILKSKWVQCANLCSPCYPGQADLDTNGEYLAYTLPKEVWGDRLGWRMVVPADMAAFYADNDSDPTMPLPDFAFRELRDKEEECK